MAHFAKISESNLVLSIEVVADADTSKDGVEDEATGVAFLQNLHGWSLWAKCSYNTFDANIIKKTVKKHLINQKHLEKIILV